MSQVFTVSLRKYLLFKIICFLLIIQQLNTSTIISNTWYDDFAFDTFQFNGWKLYNFISLNESKYYQPDPNPIIIGDNGKQYHGLITKLAGGTRSNYLQRTFICDGNVSNLNRIYLQYSFAYCNTDIIDYTRICEINSEIQVNELGKDICSLTSQITQNMIINDSYPMTDNTFVSNTLNETGCNITNWRVKNATTEMTKNNNFINSNTNFTITIKQTVNKNEYSVFYDFSLTCVPTTAKGSKGKSEFAGRLTDFENSLLKQCLVVTALIAISIVTMATIISLIKKSNRELIKVQWSTNVGRFFLITFSVALFAFYINAIAMSYFILNMENVTDTQRPWLMIFGKIPYQIGRLLMELFFILRLHFIFGQSAKAVNKFILLMLIIISFIAFVCGCIASLSSRSVYNWFEYDPKTSTFPAPATQFTIVSTAMGSFVSIFVMYLYIKILYGITVQSGETSKIEMTAVNSYRPSSPSISQNTEQTRWSISVELKRAQMQTIRNVTKNTVLGIFGLISTFFLNFKTIYELIIDTKTDSSLWRSLATLDGAINVLIMYLIFSWTNKQYDSLCYYCHKGMLKCCVFSTKRSIIKKEMTQNR